MHASSWDPEPTTGDSTPVWECVDADTVYIVYTGRTVMTGEIFYDEDKAREYLLRQQAIYRKVEGVTYTRNGGI
ncbi:hypothetical protein ACFWPU_00815 [Streptomyces sp. NPDC058471]|uniref:hypothetical protein n=1 Tax=Streptomyces sp. NPDC058471 TaxID=3346516 RepID=UPI0036583BE7